MNSNSDSDLSAHDLPATLLADAVIFSPCPIVITDPNGRIVYANVIFTNLTGYTLAELKGKTPRIFNSGKTPISVYEDLWKTILTGGIWSGELYNRKKNGEEFWESISIHSIKDQTGKITHFVSVWQDVTERKKHAEIQQQEKEGFEKQSRTDELTGLHNRRYIFSELEKEIQRAIRYKRDLAGMMIDVDNFKQINDVHGHVVGDRVLYTFAKILSASLRTIDILGRYGGDEFLVVLPETRLAEATKVAERIQKNLTIYQKDVLGDFGNISASIGLVGFDENCHRDKSIFVEKIDHVLLRAKRAGKNTIVAE